MIITQLRYTVKEKQWIYFIFDCIPQSDINDEEEIGALDYTAATVFTAKVFLVPHTIAQ